MALRKGIVLVLTLVAAIFLVLPSAAIADPVELQFVKKQMHNAKKAAPIPIWKLTQDGTTLSVLWVDAINPRFAIYDNGTPTNANDDVVLDKV